MSNRDKLKMDLLRKIVANMKQLADLYDGENHPDAHKPGEPCESCTMKVVANTIYSMGINAKATAKLGAMVMDTVAIASFGANMTLNDFRNSHLLSIIESFKLYVQDCVMDRYDITKMEDEPKGQALKDELIAYLLYNVSLSSEHVRDKVMPEYIKLEARREARKDHDLRRN